MTEREQILHEIGRLDGVVSCFWITATYRRSSAMDALEKSGEVIRKRDDPRDQYPQCVYEIRETPDAH
jgi:hypothetical protein